jgi:CheY-like chemotaxis protein/anti-sigma regulatory factor (Ser/Thr protein kinase)
MSHELRTPLNAILGFAQILEMAGLSPDHQEGIKHILASGRHLLSLINEVLDIARIETGRMSFSPEPVPVNEVIREAADLIQPMADQKSIQLQLVEISDQYVRADHQRLKQVLLNLFSNAVKYNRPGGQVRATTTVLSATQSGGTLRLEVTDTGHGIPAHKMTRLFTPFDRLDAEETDIPGTGLGLALSKSLVEAMGGVMGAESMVGQGTTFWLEMPLVEAPKERLKRTGSLSLLPASSLTKIKTVLYVEDNLSNQRLVEQILAYRPTLRLMTAIQGRLGIELAHEHQPALILLDLNLPDLHGSQVLSLLRADPRTQSIPVVVISADATLKQIERLLESGAKAYLTKPFDVKQFLQVVDEALA